MKMGRRLRCSSVTYRFRYAPSSASPARTALPAAHFDRNKIPRISGTGHQCHAAQSKPSFGDQNICFFASSRLSLLYSMVPESITFGMLFAADLFSITDASFSTAMLPIFCGN